jgi:cytochrome c oxidase assembly protein subunit 11
MITSEPIKSESANKGESRLIFKLVLFPCLMFGFGFLLIPLYDVFCDITGLNGKFDLSQTQRVQTSTSTVIPRQVTLQFTAASDQQTWQFQPATAELEITTGQQYQTFFTLNNPTEEIMEFTSIPSISPGLAAEYLIKTECFCFQKQRLQPGEQVEMPLVFQLRNELPKEYAKLTLAYRIYAEPIN